MKLRKALLSLITRDNDYQVEQASAAEAAAQRLGIDLQVVYADNDAIKQAKQILTAVHTPGPERPDVIIVEPVGTGMLRAASVAVDAGIGWVVLNRESDYLLPLREQSSLPIGGVKCDNVDIGRIQGRQFAALLPGGGTALYIEGPATEVSKQRRTGLDETVPANITVLTNRGNWTMESGERIVASKLQRLPYVDLISCQNDAMAMGARRAVEALPAGELRDAWLELPVTGVDGVPAGGQAWVAQRSLAATVVVPTLAGLALDLVTKATETDTPMPERTVVPVTSYPPVEELAGG